MYLDILGLINSLVSPRQITGTKQFIIIGLTVWKVLQGLVFFLFLIILDIYYLLHLKCNFRDISEHLCNNLREMILKLIVLISTQSFLWYFFPP